jgi:aerobic carbon-monoxide dehydrogenase large subunit
LAEEGVAHEVLPARSVGSRVRRKEDARLTTGRGRYVGDMKVRGMLHAAALRSPYAHARITGIDASAALAVDGVVAFYSAQDIHGKVKPFPEPALRELNPVAREAINLDIKSHPMEPLPSERVLWSGQPIGYLVAEDRYIAEDAIESIFVEYDPLPVAGDIDSALGDGAPILHPHLGSNIQQTYFVETGDVQGAFANADRSLRLRLSMGRQVANAMEPRGMLADYDGGRDQITVWSTSIRPHLLRTIITEMLDMPTDSVRCIGPDIGGSFGSGMFHEEVLIPFLARDLKRPIRWIEDRRENLQNTRHARDQVHDVEVAFNTDGTIIGIRDDFKVDFGAHNNYAITVSYNVAAHLRGPFKVDNFSVACTGVLTNKAPCAPVRGAGRPECAYVMDRIIDSVADALDIDPVDVRVKNLIPPDALPYDMGIPYRDGHTIVYDRGDFPGQTKQVLELIGFSGWKTRRESGPRNGGRVGIGVASYLEGSGVGPHEGAIVRIDQTGRINVYTGAQPHGQGLETTLAQVAADQLGVDPDHITVRATDTSTIPFGVGTFASRSGVVAGNAVAIASVRLREKVLAVAGELLEASPQDLELVDGRARVKGTPDKAVGLREIAHAAAPGPRSRVPAGMDPGLEVQYYFVPPTVTWASGTHAAVVEVDEETGFVTVLDYASVDDCGQMLNPMIVEGQVHGGIAHGIGNAMLEEAVYDSEGQLLTSTYMDYLLPTAAEMPNIKVAHQKFVSELNPLGVKGAGEGGAVSPPAAIANAIVDAFRPLKLKINHAPVTPEIIFRAIQAAKKSDVDS